MFNDMTYEEVYDKYIQPQKIQAFNDGYEQGRIDAIDECIEIIVKTMPAEPFLKNSKHYENWKMKTTELRMLRDMVEQLKSQDSIK